LKKFVRTVIIILIVGIVSGIIYQHIDEISDYSEKFIEQQIARHYTDDFSQYTPLSTFYFENLSEIGKKAYIAIFNGIKEHSEKIDVPVLEDNSLNKIYSAIELDNPDLLCIPDSVTYVKQGVRGYVEIKYTQSKSKCDEMTKELYDKVKEISENISDTSSDFDKELYIHDYIVDSCQYVETEHDDDAYGCLINGKAICSGYSEAFKILLNYNNIESELIIGTGIDDEDGKIKHEWNTVKINNNYYFTDVTWDDPLISDNNYYNKSHMYFNIDKDTLDIDHIDYNLPPSITCGSIDSNYFVRRSLLYDVYDDNTKKAISNDIFDCIGSGRKFVEFCFSNDSAYQTAVSRLFSNNGSDVGEIIYNMGYSDKFGRISYQTNDSHRYIKICFGQ